MVSERVLMHIFLGSLFGEGARHMKTLCVCVLVCVFVYVYVCVCMYIHKRNYICQFSLCLMRMR